MKTTRACLFQKIRFVILLCIGISGPLSVFFFSYNPFFMISPAPSVFTYENKYKSKIFFSRYSNTIKIDELNMDRRFYQNINGPHRYKVLFNSIMKRGGRLVENPSYKKFIVNYICNVNSNLKITNVEVKTANRLLKEFECEN